MKDSNEIKYLEFPENVRKRPGMYIGDTNTSDVLVREIIDNSIDEFYNNNKSGLLNIYHNNNKVLVADNGRGIPLMNSSVKDSNGDFYTQARLAVEKLHAGSKFDNKESVSTGTHGLGSAIVSALSDKFMLFVNLNKYDKSSYSDKIKILLENNKIKKNSFYKVEYEKGILISESIIELSNEFITENFKLNTKLNLEETSTIVYFIPDLSIIESPKITIPNLSYRKYITKLLYNKSISIYINDNLYEEEFIPFEYKFKSIIGNNTFLISFKLSEKIEKEKFTGSVNGLIVNQGVHKDWSIRAYKDAFKDYFGSLNSYESYGLIINTIVLSSNPSYTSQIKTELSQLDKLTYTQAKQLCDNFKLIFKKNHGIFKDHYDQLVLFTSKITNISKKTILESKISLSSNSNKFIAPDNLMDCYTKDRSKAELYIVEGESAAGSLMNARNPEIHAVLPLKGKPLNCVGLDIIDILDNSEINSIIKSLGTGVDEYHNIDNIRYGKIILASDSDSDGFHIQMLLIGLFLSQMKYLIENEYVYIAKNPLYNQENKYYFENEFDKIDKTKPFIRFKGLGQANPEQLEEFMLNKEKRYLYKITLEDLENSLNLISSPEVKRDLMIKENFFKFNEKLKV